MKVDAVVKVKQVDKSTKKVEIYSPSFSHGVPLIILPEQYVGVPVKLVTEWGDIPQETPVTVNGCIIDDAQVGKCKLARGMFIQSFGDNTVFVVVTPHFL